jgi:hypothetical protein
MLIGVLLTLALLAFASPISTNASASNASTIEAPKWNSVPCPAGVQPNVAQVSWSTYNRKTGAHRAGQWIVWRLHHVRRIYSTICGLNLIQPLVLPCPANPSGATGKYHIRFLQWTKNRKRTLLRVTEVTDGCITLVVDGRPGLGAASLLGSGLLVP